MFACDIGGKMPPNTLTDLDKQVTNPAKRVIKHLDKRVIKHLDKQVIKHPVKQVIKHLDKQVIKHPVKQVIKHLDKRVIKHLDKRVIKLKQDTQRASPGILDIQDSSRPTQAIQDISH